MIAIAGVIGDQAVMETEAVLRTSVATLTLLMLVLPAAAQQPLRPAVKQVQCPLGTMQSGGYCMPTWSYTRYMNVSLMVVTAP